MQFIYDNLVAGLISMTVFLILVVIQAEAIQINTARLSRNIAKNQAHDFVTWMEEDLAKMGKNMAPGSVAYETLEDSGRWHTETFVFSFLNSSGDTIKTKYDLKQTGTRMVEGKEDTLFVVKRSRKVGGSWTSRGQSPESLGSFEIDVVDENADSTANPDNVEFIKIRFSVIAPFQSESTFLRRVYRSTVVPYRLAGN